MSSIFFFGNGFDISMGMQTHYETFIKSKYFREFRNDAINLGAFIERKRTQNGWVDLECALSDFSVEFPVFDIFDEYNLLRIKLQEFISQIQCMYSTDSPALDLIRSKFTPGDQIHVFNYTKTVHLAFSKNSVHKPDDYIHHVHGSLDDDNIIVGIDESQQRSNIHSFMLKSAHDNFNIRRISADLEGSVAVYWFGHSLGKSDSIYFKDFFKGIIDGRLRGERKLVFYHHGASDKRNIIARITELCDGNLAYLKKSNSVEFINSELQ